MEIKEDKRRNKRTKRKDVKRADKKSNVGKRRYEQTGEEERPDETNQKTKERMTKVKRWDQMRGYKWGLDKKVWEDTRWDKQRDQMRQKMKRETRWEIRRWKKTNKKRQDRTKKQKIDEMRCQKWRLNEKIREVRWDERKDVWEAHLQTADWRRWRRWDRAERHRRQGTERIPVWDPSTRPPQRTDCVCSAAGVHYRSEPPSPDSPETRRWPAGPSVPSGSGRQGATPALRSKATNPLPSLWIWVYPDVSLRTCRQATGCCSFLVTQWSRDARSRRWLVDRRFRCFWGCCRSPTGTRVFPLRSGNQTERLTVIYLISRFRKVCLYLYVKKNHL